jgi:hypothetical protein
MHIVKSKRVVKSARCVIGVQVVATSTVRNLYIVLTQCRDQSKKQHSCKICLIYLCVFYHPFFGRIDTTSRLPQRFDKNPL